MASCRIFASSVSCIAALVLASSSVFAANTDNSITVGDAALSAAFYADSSCLLTIDAQTRAGRTVIDADVDDAGSRMLIHCDTESGRRLTLLARGESLTISQRVPLLTREQISEGSYGMISWLTRRGVHYADDNAPRRYVIAGNVLLTRSPPVDVAGYALHTQRQAFARVSGLLEPILKSDNQPVMEQTSDVVPNTPTDMGEENQQPATEVQANEPASDEQDKKPASGS